MINIWSVFDWLVFIYFKLIMMLRRFDDDFEFPASHCNSSTITARIYPKIVAICNCLYLVSSVLEGLFFV